MLGKGTKRKLDEDEEGLAEGAPVEGGPGGTGDPSSKLSYSLQRQTVLSLSLMKLYHPRALAEPSLERRLLVNNVLRRIQEELKQEGGPQALFLHPPSPPSEHHPLGEGFREAQPAFGVPPVATTPFLPPTGLAPVPPDSCLTPASLLEDDTPLLCTPLPTSTPQRPTPIIAKDSFSSALDEIEDLCETQGPTATSPPSPVGALPHLPSVAPMGIDSKDGAKPCSQKLGVSALLSEGQPAVGAQESRLMETQLPGGLDISSSSSSGFLTDLTLDDVLFADIDTSMYDFDACTASASGGAGKMAPLVTADDLLKSLSPYAGSGSTATPVSPSQPFKMDLAELDHIMEVLVGS
ncbi:SERTA domain-containing protein 2b isoform X1 [Paramormyrops kingsleyae]|uniref:SERTA domain-containing protein 2b isoform X1 n=1 Tax=Paramormyrops kingsleyae TaxID=1676925 RepID=UPI000CD60DE9|nr:SERTA domain-containing protein 2-like isoform X1 [Paramormyrops kingsleyae]XP_023698075.1 SERTA domain-containing protein 2-like isoform X1 [Paramormyrops kingsleyae]